MFLAGHGPFATKEDFIRDWNSFDKAVDNLTYAVIPTDGAADVPPVATGQFSFLTHPPRGRISRGRLSSDFPPQMARTRTSTEAQFLLMQHVFEDLQYRRYEWKCNADNQPSMATARRLGFTFEGTFRQDQINHGRNRIQRGGAFGY